MSNVERENFVLKHILPPLFYFFKTQHKLSLEGEQQLKTIKEQSYAQLTNYIQYINFI